MGENLYPCLLCLECYLMFIFFAFSFRVVHCKPFSSVERVNCQTVFLDTAGPFQLIMWKKMMHVLHTS